MNIKEIKKEALLARICATRQIMGEDAAQAAAESINQLLKEKEEINILFAAAPSQNEFLAALQKYALPWNRIHALHMDEYIGLQADAPQRFGNYLKEHIFAALPFKSCKSIPSTLFSWESVKTGTSPLMTRMWHCLMIPSR